MENKNIVSIKLSDNVNDFNCSSIENISKYLNDKFKGTIQTKKVYVEQDDYKIENTHKHPLIYSLNIGYSDHIPVVLKPEHIWMVIVSSLAQHINYNEKYKNKFSKENGVSISEKKS